MSIPGSKIGPIHIDAKRRRGASHKSSEVPPVEAVLREEREITSAILDTVGALVIVLDPGGRIVRFNPACEQTSGLLFANVKGLHLWEMFPSGDERERSKRIFDELRAGREVGPYEMSWPTKDNGRRLIHWSNAVVRTPDARVRHIIMSGIDRTESRDLEQTILEISSREQRRIGQDLHDGLGQHLTGIAFMTKVQEQRLAEKSLPEASDAAKIVDLVNEAIHKTRELARGLVPVLSESQGLMSALEQWASEMQDLFQIRCRFVCEDPVLLGDDNVASHLYRIAQEAVHNAIKHGRAHNVSIKLSAGGDEGALEIQDDGCGIGAVIPQSTGMGLRIMNYRARMIAGSLQAKQLTEGGTRVTCIFPLRQGGTC